MDLLVYADLPKSDDQPSARVNPAVKRLLLKTDNHALDDIKVKMKKSLLRRC